MGTYNPPLPKQNFIPKQAPVVGAAWLNAIDNLLQGNVPATGVYQSSFISGQVQVTGPDGNLASYGDLTFGLALPGPGGTAPSLLIGGAGKSTAQIITDAQIPGLPGIDLFIAAGESDASGTSRGGTLWLFGGASFGGQGGPLLLQGGTSVSGDGGGVTLLGGNSTSGGVAGSVFILAGTEGGAGGSIKMYATNLNGVAGDISFWLGQPDIPHSVPLWTMSHTGALFPANSGAGNAVDQINMIPASQLLSGGNLASPTWGQPGIKSSFLATLSGDIVPESVVVNCATDGRQVTLWIEGGTAGQTTGPGDLILSTLPVGLRPSSNRVVFCGALQNASGNGYFGAATVTALGGVIITLGIPTNGGNSLGTLPNNWSTLPGASKGLTDGWSITYAL